MKTWIAFASCTLGLVLALTIGCASAESSDGGGAERQAAERPSVTADSAAGQVVYDTNCAACHRAGRHDPEGDALDLIGKRITARRLSRHHGASLSEQDAANLRAFLANP